MSELYLYVFTVLEPSLVKTNTGSYNSNRKSKTSIDPAPAFENGCRILVLVCSVYSILYSFAVAKYFFRQQPKLQPSLDYQL